MFNGWIKIHTSMLDWEWYNHESVKVLFLHCLLKANWKDSKWQGIDIPRGSFVASQYHLAEDLNCSRMTIRRNLEKLQKTGEVVLQTTHRYTMITVCNYEAYQCCDESGVTSPVTTPVTSPVTKLKTNRLIKNNNNKLLLSKDEILEWWNGLCEEFPFLAKISKVTSQRLKKVNECNKATGFWEKRDSFREGLQNIHSSHWDKTWCRSFDSWMKVTVNKVPKILKLTEDVMAYARPFEERTQQSFYGYDGGRF